MPGREREREREREFVCNHYKLEQGKKKHKNRTLFKSKNTRKRHYFKRFLFKQLYTSSWSRRVQIPPTYPIIT
jgi:hypothetical protein